MLRYGDKKFILIRRLISFYYEVFQFIFRVGPKKNLFLEADKYLKNNKVDFILATGEPFVLFHYANKLSEKYNIPWIGDYRDPWSLNTENLVSPLLKLWFDFQEKSLLKKMNLIITVSDYMAKKIDYYNSNEVPIEIIPNGYDSDSIEWIKSIAQNGDRLTLSFAGIIYPYHPYHDFLKTLEDFSLANSNFQFNLNFYGVNIENDLKLLINKEFPRMKESTKFFPKLPNQKLLVELARSNVLILFNDYSFLGTKIYDYLGVNRLILLCFTNEWRTKLNLAINCSKT
jgi:glycosyltransferase involved in cell wall biosynthesis